LRAKNWKWGSFLYCWNQNFVTAICWIAFSTTDFQSSFLGFSVWFWPLLHWLLLFCCCYLLWDSVAVLLLYIVAPDLFSLFVVRIPGTHSNLVVIKLWSWNAAIKSNRFNKVDSRQSGLFSFFYELFYFLFFYFFCIIGLKREGIV